jgi:hypothetical protein
MVVDLHEGGQPTVTVEGRWLTTKPGTPTPPGDSDQAAAQAPPASAGQAKTAAAADLTQPQTTGRTTIPTQQPGNQNATLGTVHTPNSPRAAAGPVSTGLTAPGEQVPSPVDSGAKNLTPRPVVTGSQAAIGTPSSINDHPTMQMLVMLKKSGVGFSDAMQVLKDLNPGVKLPPKEILKGFWNTLPAPTGGETPLAKQPLDNLIRDAAWQKQHPIQQAPAQPTTPQTTSQQSTQQASGQRASAEQAAAQLPTPRTPARADLPPQAMPNTSVPANVDPRGVVVAGSAEHAASRAGADLSPTLQTVVVNNTSNQAYVAGLSTAEFQRLAAMLGANAPEWFWQVRNHHGLRRLLEMPSFARLSAVRIAGVRMLFWLFAVIGMAIFWLVGARFGVWW